jgi:hypothetical protein
LTDTTFRCEAIAPGDVDRLLCGLRSLRLERNEAGLFIDVAVHDAELAAATLARAGLRCVGSTRPDPPRGAIAAVAFDLAPVQMAGLTDRISVRVSDVSEATARARRGLLWRRYDAERVRALLRGEERLYAWRRVIWAPRSVLKARAVRGVRPIVFDQGAVSEGAERWESMRSGRLAVWLAA